MDVLQIFCNVDGRKTNEMSFWVMSLVRETKEYLSMMSKPKLFAWELRGPSQKSNTP
jgi:hypothetical protein